MFIDTHMHEMTYSKDSFLRLDEMVSIARQKGVGGICITDHDSMGLKDYAAEYTERTGFPVFVGIEFFSWQGDIVAFGIEDYPRERVPAQEFIDLVKAQGGVCFAAHPFRNNNRGLEENLRAVHGLDGLEVLNGSTSAEACMKAAEYAMELNIANKVAWHGFCIDAKQKIVDAGIFVLPSNYEGVSNAMVEAMAMGIPVIATDCPIGGAATYIRDGENGMLVPTKDATEMAAAMKKIASDPLLAKRLSDNCIKIREEFPSGVIADKLLGIAGIMV